MKKVNNNELFNAGFLYFYNKNDYYTLVDRILSDKNELYLMLDDQTLFNYFVEGEIETTKDNRFNYKVGRDVNTHKNVSVYHFLANSRDKMKEVFDKGFDFDII